MIDNFTKRRRIRFTKDKFEKEIRKKSELYNNSYNREYLKLDKPIPTRRIGKSFVIKQSSRVNLKYSELLYKLKKLCSWLNKKFRYELDYCMIDDKTLYISDKKYDSLSDDEKEYFTCASYLIYKGHHIKHEYYTHLILVPRRVKIYEVPILDRYAQSVRAKLRYSLLRSGIANKLDHKSYHEHYRKGRRLNDPIIEGIEEYYSSKLPTE